MVAQFVREAVLGQMLGVMSSTHYWKGAVTRTILKSIILDQHLRCLPGTLVLPIQLGLHVLGHQAGVRVRINITGGGDSSLMNIFQ